MRQVYIGLQGEVFDDVFYDPRFGFHISRFRLMMGENFLGLFQRLMNQIDRHSRTGSAVKTHGSTVIALVEQLLQGSLSFHLFAQPVFQSVSENAMQIIGNRNPVANFSSQKDGALVQFAAFAAMVKLVFLDAAIPNAAP